MNIDNQELAEKVVIAFKNTLTESTRTAITEKEFNELHLIIKEALSQQLSVTADKVGELSRELKSMADRQDIGL